MLLGGLLFGALTGCGAANGPATLTVPGALTVSVYCGGETAHADGNVVQFTPAGRLCEVEAPLSHAMPLRGRLQVRGGGNYRCERHPSGMDLVCGRAP